MQISNVIPTIVIVLPTTIFDLLVIDICKLVFFLRKKMTLNIHYRCIYTSSREREINFCVSSISSLLLGYNPVILIKSILSKEKYHLYDQITHPCKKNFQSCECSVKKMIVILRKFIKQIRSIHIFYSLFSYYYFEKRIR